MLAEQRRDRVLTELRSRGAIRVGEVAELLGVSDMTIRRDLEELERQQLLRRVHGGATVLTHGTRDEPGFAAKSGIELVAKTAIARHAASLVSPGMTIAISAGTTTHAFAQAIAQVPGLTIVTNSTDAASFLFEEIPASSEVVLIGGVRTPSHAMVGPLAVAALENLNVDTVFHGFHGFSLHAGFTCPNLDEAATAKAMIRCGQRLVVLADHTKWGTVSLARVAGLNQAQLLITDDQLPSQIEEVLTQHITEVARVPTGLRAV